MVNESIRCLVFLSGFAQWQIADQIGVSEFTLSRWLRKPLTEQQETAIREAVEQLKARKENSGC